VTAIALGTIAVGNIVAVLPARTARRVDPMRPRDAESP
jgi:hypothetical protein